MEALQVVGLVFIIAGALAIARSALTGKLTTNTVIIAIILVIIGAFLLR